MAEPRTPAHQEYADGMTERMMREMQAAGMAAMLEYCKRHGLTAPYEMQTFAVKVASGREVAQVTEDVRAIMVYWPDDRVTVVTTQQIGKRAYLADRALSGHGDNFNYWRFKPSAEY